MNYTPLLQRAWDAGGRIVEWSPDHLDRIQAMVLRASALPPWLLRAQTRINARPSKPIPPRTQVAKPRPIVHRRVAPKLTASQLEVLRLRAEGLSCDEIADRRGCKESTVTTLLQRVRERLDAHDTGHAIAIAMRDGIFS